MKKSKYIFSNGLVDLAQTRLGSKIVFKTDDFFASANRILIQLLLYSKKVLLISTESGWTVGKLEEEEEKAMII